MKRILKIAGKFFLGLIILLLIFAAFVQFSPKKIYSVNSPDLKVIPDSIKIEEGARIASMLCASCHRSSDGKLGGALMEDGMFGVIYSANITQDPTYGIANYTDGELAYLLRTGINRKGEYTPPWMAKLPNLSDDDIESIISFLRSDNSMVQPSDNNPPLPEYTFLTKMLLKLGMFGPLPYPEKPIIAPDTNDMVAFGKYISTAKFDCYSCHSLDFTKVDAMIPEKSVGFFGGGNPVEASIVDENGNIILSANLTMDKETGLGDWTEDQFLKAVKQGVGPNSRPIRNPMVPFTALTDHEVKSVWAYLQTIPVIKNEKLVDRLK